MAATAMALEAQAWPNTLPSDPPPTPPESKEMKRNSASISLAW